MEGKERAKYPNCTYDGPESDESFGIDVFFLSWMG